MKYDLTAYIQHFGSPLIENKIPHFYLDGRDILTIGIGCVVRDPTELKMVRKSDGQPATRAEIFSDYNGVKAQSPGRYASFYDHVCQLILPEPEIDLLFKIRLDEIIREIEIEAMPLDSLPAPAALVVVDMGFNLGPTKLRDQFPKFLNALKSNPPNYHVAALECKREGIQKERNEWARQTLDAVDGEKNGL